MSDVPLGDQPPRPGPSWQHEPPAYQAPPGPDASAGRGFTIGAFVCAAIALFILPPVFGIAGIILGSVGRSKGDPLGRTAMIVSGVCLVLGMIIGIIVLASR